MKKYMSEDQLEKLSKLDKLDSESKQALAELYVASDEMIIFLQKLKMNARNVAIFRGNNQENQLAYNRYIEGAQKWANGELLQNFENARLNFQSVIKEIADEQEK